MLGSATPQRPSEPNPCDERTTKNEDKTGKEVFRGLVAQALQNLEGPHHSFSLSY